MPIPKQLVDVSRSSNGNDFVYDAKRENSMIEDGSDNFDDESSYSSSAHSTSTDDFPTQHAGLNGKEDAFADNLAKKLTRDVKVWRSIVSFMLLLTAILVTVSTYIFLTAEETRDFQDAFTGFANRLGDIAHSRTYALSFALASRAESLTAMVEESTSQAWPFVTVSHFEVRGENTRLETRTEIFAFAPLVENETAKTLWNNYSVSNQDWLLDSYERATIAHPGAYKFEESSTAQIEPEVYRVEGNWQFWPEKPNSSPAPWLPLWQISPPPPDPYPINFNMLSSPDVNRLVEYVQVNKVPVMSDKLVRHPMFSNLVEQYADITPAFNETYPLTAVDTEGEGDSDSSDGGGGRRELLSGSYNKSHVNEEGYIFVLYPVYDTFDEERDRNLKGIFLSLLRWDWMLSDAIHEGTDEMIAVMNNNCGEAVYSYSIKGTTATYLGVGDQHDQRYNDKVVTTPLNAIHGVSEGGVKCDFSIDVYPTVEMREAYTSSQAVVFTTILGLAFATTALFFLFYVRIVQRRQTKVMATAARTNAIVTSLFPSNVRDRIMKDAEDAVNNNKEIVPFLPGMGEAPKKKLKTFLDEENPGTEDQLVMFKTKPIADLFPETTVMFADLVGFTAWSSVREPTQVFQLLETIYHSFDEIARRRRVFKVETVGDCYVAVVGLPDPRKDHAVIMARFARDCMQTVSDLTKKLEVTLGPDTGDLQIRIGLHSGPVTAGVLRGEKSRFQLFGDTVNTAARMESTGQPSKIQLSKETADLLLAAGKSNWMREREEKVRAKGKGELQTYWLEVRHEGAASVTSGSSNSDFIDEELKMPQPAAKPMKDSGPTARPLDAKAKRLVDWNCDQMIRLLKLIVARRNAQARRSSQIQASTNEEFLNANLRKVGTVLEEVREIITLPKFDPKVYRNHDDPDSVQLNEDVLQQLHDYVSTIATLYRDNPFHNFEHASHVTMSVSKLLSRIVSPQDINRNHNENSEQKIEDYAWEVHKSTYGITSDPLTQFAVVFSALIHDVDHTGVPNATLVKENAKIAELYKQKSVAEQNSVDLAWDMLMDTKYAALQNVLYTNTSELDRFRQLVVNSVMATDIVDKDLKALRNARWDKAFKDVEEDEDKDVNRKATIVIEHLIQASDVAHTMQHWHIFRKWNERLFQEMHKAYREGRAEKDPSEFWYKGEIGFFDFYIIPLAKKLKECGVFGVSSDEYLNYAMKNREEWIVKGNEIVQQMLERVPTKESLEEQAEEQETAPLGGGTRRRGSSGSKG
ncbi:Receptor-type guanylate cyclase gcy [Seminavis robusta]|uniref:Receptor-type guanylate cyclase gcy n=1 Tax=Seminavis robusta TaxID=568900 RepID=A0A9N8E268_9STRA|nr:Receptor-type guanylate cyclase gcy [Seminavis robusta]|eukprot:Sro454_g146430.1 Receptor-type guanylate cyclase gcy (1258) ;mRNA; f:55731-60472